MIRIGGDFLETIAKIEKWLAETRKWFLPICCLVLTISIIAMFIVSLCVDSTTVSDISNFVSIILGIIAFSTSIISTVLSFYNLEKSELLNKEQQESLRIISDIQQEISKTLSRVEDKTNEFTSGINSTFMYKRVPQKRDSDWENKGEKNG